MSRQGYIYQRDNRRGERIAVPAGITPDAVFRAVGDIERETGEPFMDPPDERGFTVFRSYYTDRQWAIMKQAAKKGWRADV